MSADLAGVRAKIDRAQHHFDALQADMHWYMNSDSDSTLGFVIEIDHDSGDFWARCGEHTTPPVAWSAVLGEFFYDLRSALDHLAHQLVVASGKVPNRPQFPVYKTKAEYDARPARYTAGMSDDAIALIERSQPWNDWPEHPEQTTLWRIHELCNVDKHRLLHLADLWLKGTRVNFLLPCPPDRAPKITKQFLATKPQRLKPNAYLAHMTWDPAAMKAIGDGQVQVNVELSIDIALNEGTWLTSDGKPTKGASIDHLMKVALDYVETTLLPRFQPFFD